MKKSIFLITIIISLISCKSAEFDSGLKHKGYYDDKINIAKLIKGKNEVVFIPMHHFGTELFYKDVKSKIDSLKKIGFYFYYEKVNFNLSDTTTLMKYKKIHGFPISKDNGGYMYLIDSIYKFKLKKKLINQPSYVELGVESTNGKNVDVTLKEMINFYENKYGIIKLELCDYRTSIYEKSICKDKIIDEKNKDDAILNFRNKHILEELKNDYHPKIAIIYGAGHFIGIKEELLKLGYK